MSKPGIYVVGDSCVREIGFVIRRVTLDGTYWANGWWEGPDFGASWSTQRHRARIHATRHEAHALAIRLRGDDRASIRVVRLMVRVQG